MYPMDFEEFKWALGDTVTIMKIDSTGKAVMLFKSISSQLEKNASRYQVSSVLENQRNSTVLELISEMESSKTVLVSYKSDDPNAGLTRTKDLGKDKDVFSIPVYMTMFL